MNDIEVKPSSIQGLGIFARRPFRAGDRIGRVNVVREITAESPNRGLVGVCVCVGRSAIKRPGICGLNAFYGLDCVSRRSLGAAPAVDRRGLRFVSTRIRCNCSSFRSQSLLSASAASICIATNTEVPGLRERTLQTLCRAHYCCSPQAWSTQSSHRKVQLRIVRISWRILMQGGIPK